MQALRGSVLLLLREVLSTRAWLLPDDQAHATTPKPQQPARPRGLQSRAMASANGAAVDERVAQLRSKLKEVKVDAYIIPTADAHQVRFGRSRSTSQPYVLLDACLAELIYIAAEQSEYPAECDARRAWISHFTGSAGTAVVTQQHALLWTDGRYFLQASPVGLQSGPAIPARPIESMLCAEAACCITCASMNDQSLTGRQAELLNAC